MMIGEEIYYIIHIDGVGLPGDSIGREQERGSDLVK